MTNKDSNTVGFVGCDAKHDHSHGGDPDASRRVVQVNGRRVTTADIHAHCIIPEAMRVPGRENQNAALEVDDLDTRLVAMDAQGIDIEVEHPAPV